MILQRKRSETVKKLNDRILEQEKTAPGCCLDRHSGSSDSVTYSYFLSPIEKKNIDFHVINKSLKITFPPSFPREKGN